MNYLGQSEPIFTGTSRVRPATAGFGRRHDQSQLLRLQCLGNVTNSIDWWLHVYAHLRHEQTVGIDEGPHDALTARTSKAGGPTTRSTPCCDLHHASGRTTTNTYNAAGQIFSTTIALGETTTFSYATNGYLLSITGPLQNASDVTTFTYDAFGRDACIRHYVASIP